MDTDGSGEKNPVVPGVTAAAVVPAQSELPVVWLVIATVLTAGGIAVSGFIAYRKKEEE